MYNQNKNQRRVMERRSNATRPRARKPRLMTGKILLGCFGCWLFYPNWEPLHWARQKTMLSDQRAPIGTATSKRRASRDEPSRSDLSAWFVSVWWFFTFISVSPSGSFILQLMLGPAQSANRPSDVRRLMAVKSRTILRF